MKVKAGALITITAMAVVAFAAPAAAGTSRECPDADTGDNVRLKLAPGETCTIPEGVTVGGNIRVKGGWLFVKGTVKGDVMQRRDGGVEIKQSGTVFGNVTEGGDQGVRVYGHVAGNISERGEGAVYVQGTVNGNISERGAGDVSLLPIISWPASVNGNVREAGKGNLDIEGKVGGSAGEFGKGSCSIDGKVGGSLLGGC